LLPAAIVFAVVGGPLVAIWTHGEAQPEPSLVALMALVMFLHGAWFYVSNILSASNRHTRIAGRLLFAAIGTTVLAVPAGHFLGLNGVALSVAVGELVCAAIVARAFVAERLPVDVRWVFRSILSLNLRANG
jgi:O-antigen/teichoic acid export membrane protein